MNNVVGKFVSLWLHPWKTMQAVRDEGETVGIKPAMLFVLIMGLVGGIIATIWGYVTPPAAVLNGQLPKWTIALTLLIVPFVSFVLSFVGAFILWSLVYGLVKGTTTEYNTMYRLFAILAAFSPINALLTPIPRVGEYIGLVINIWGLIVLIHGVVIVAQTPKVRTWVSLGIVFLVLFFLGMVFRNEAQRAMESDASFSDLGGPTSDDFGLNEDRALDDLQSAPPATEKPKQ